MKIQNSPSSEGRGFVAPFSDVRRLLAHGRIKEGGTLWYLGEKVESLLELRDISIPNVEIGDVQLDSYADGVEGVLLSMDEQLLSPGANRLAWDVSAVSEMNPTVSDLHLNVSRFLHMVDCLSRGGQHVFLVDDLRLGETLAKTGQLNGFCISWKGPRSRPPSLYRQLRARASAMKTALERKWELFFLRRHKPVAWGQLRQCDVLVFDWIEANSYQSMQEVGSTRNLRRVPDILRCGGHNVGFIFSPITWNQSFSDITKSVKQLKDAVAFVDDCKSTWDVVCGVWANLRLSTWLTGKLLYNDIDLTPLFMLMREKDSVVAHPPLAYSYAAIAKTLKNRGITPKAIFYPYENQGWERALRQGVRKHLPDTRLVAYQYAPFADRHISFYPFASDICDGRVPDELICMAQTFKEQFLRRDFPEDRISIGGTVMFEKVMKTDRPQQKKSHRQGEKVILCTTPINYSDSLSIAEKVVAAAEVVGRLKVIVNFHPTVDSGFKESLSAEIEKRHPAFFDQVEFSSDPAYVLLSRVDGVCYNISGTVFESLMYGLPAFYVPVDGRVSQNKLPNDLVQIATHHDELCRAFTRLLERDGLGGAEIKPEQLRMCLQEVNEQVFLNAVSS